MKLGELAARLGAELVGGTGADAETDVSGVAGIEQAGPSQVSFVANPKYAGLAKSTRAAALIVEPEFAALPGATLRVKNPYLAWARERMWGRMWWWARDV